MSEIETRKKEYKDFVEKDFNSLLKKLNDDDDLSPENETWINMLSILKTYFDDMRDLDPREPYFDVEPLIDRIKEERETNTYKNKYLIGCFVSALVACGSPALQAYEAVGEFLGHKNRSPETSKKAHTYFKRLEKESVDSDAERFVYMHVYSLKNLLKTTQRDFPEHQSLAKAKSAYDVLLTLIEKNLSTEGPTICR